MTNGSEASIVNVQYISGRLQTHNRTIFIFAAALLNHFKPTSIGHSTKSPQMAGFRRKSGHSEFVEASESRHSPSVCFPKSRIGAIDTHRKFMSNSLTISCSA
jgi:hypothetical protein